MQKEIILEKIKQVPNKPGVYLWKDIDENVIYVGKAINLRKRLHQYLEGSLNSYKTAKMVDLIRDFEIYVVRNNKEALVLEKQLIEKYNPEFNILLLDDKRYPYLKIELNNDKLEINLIRKIKKPENENLFYFGPFPNGYGSTLILKLLEREAFYEKGLPIKNSNRNFWKSQFLKIKEILKFNNKEYLKKLKEKMHEASENLQFEVAKDIRDSLNFLNKLNEEQIVELKNLKNIDVFTYQVDNEFLYITILFYRYGILINKDNQIINLKLSLNDVLENFLIEYYKNKIIPDEFVVSKNFLELNLQLPFSTKLISPKIGIYKKILEIAELNMTNFYSSKAEEAKQKLLLAEKKERILSDFLNLPNIKNVLLFDNSNFANFNPIGVAVLYTNGQKNKNYYRKFNHSLINEREADVEYMYQTAYKYFTSEKENLIPDLIIADGGLPQIHEIKKVLKELKLNIPVIGLVKDNYHRTRTLIDLNEKEVNILKNREIFNFLSEMQIEVDRFAKEHLRKRNKIVSLEGKLLSIDGLGEKTEKKLLNHFGTYNNIYNASLEALEKVVSKRLAKKIYEKEYTK
ncbi:GIY-YIG nuclease family protein [Mycoplasmopsis gallinarum]